MKKNLAAMIMAITLVSCEPMETPNNLSKQAFNIRIEADYLEENEPAWILLHDMEGNPLDFKPFSNNVNLAFEIDSNEERVLVTVVKKRDRESFDRYIVETITSVDSKKEFVLGLKKPLRSNSFDPNGEFEVIVSHQQHLNSTFISNSEGHTSGSAIFGGFQSSAKMTLSQNSQNYFASTRSDSEEIRYSFISQPQNGQQVNLTFSQMQTFDKVLKIPYYQVGSLIYTVKVLEKVAGNWKESFWLNTNIQEGHPAIDDYQIGYLNRFETYETFIRATISSQTVAGLVKIGKAPTTLQLPLSKNIDMISSKISNPEINSDMVYNNWSGDWRLRDGSGNLTVMWTVWGKDSGFKLKAFPLEFTTDHPQFSNLESFQLISMKLMQSHLDYENLVERKYVELDILEETEEYYLQKRF
ncbi:hypothetical protein [Aquiflexum lacus]|uniref:hypothetical protein n=1 Tax=Aquiflexum lacus TaxID=2483805 RepID=UPI001894A9E5|nr:hypothetical protein [Aquiflexum lacus]